MEEKPNYFAIIPASVRYDKDLRANEKLLYGEITALANKFGECWASNSYFAKLYNVVPSVIPKWIKDLQDKGYIKIEYVREGKEIKSRRIKVLGTHKCDEGVLTNVYGGYSQKCKDNNTSINNTSINKEEIYKEEIFDYDWINEEDL